MDIEIFGNYTRRVKQCEHVWSSQWWNKVAKYGLEDRSRLGVSAKTNILSPIPLAKIKTGTLAICLVGRPQICMASVSQKLLSYNIIAF